MARTPRLKGFPFNVSRFPFKTNEFLTGNRKRETRNAQRLYSIGARSLSFYLAVPGMPQAPSISRSHVSTGNAQRETGNRKRATGNRKRLHSISSRSISFSLANSTIPQIPGFPRSHVSTGNGKRATRNVFIPLVPDPSVSI
jgi:hypothetical protein